MSDLLHLTVDGVPVSVPAGTTILQAAQQAGSRIPTICTHQRCTSNGLCRVCVVEVEGARTLVASCVAQAAQGMVVHTSTPRVLRARRTILEMLAASVDLSEAPEILDHIIEAQASLERFPLAERREHHILDDNPMYIRDYARCVLCWRCVQVCAEDAQYTFALTFGERGHQTRIATFYDRSMPETTCVFCGQCVGVCPSGALKSRREWLLEQGHNPTEIMSQTRTQRRKRQRQAERKEQES